MTRPLPTLNEGQTVYVHLMMGQSWEKGTVVKQTHHRKYEVLVEDDYTGATGAVCEREERMIH